MKNKMSLGRGLDAVFLENETPVEGNVSMLRISEVEPNPDQPRKNFDKTALEQLADSIAQHGVIQPIAVRKGKENGFYEIIAGERRWRAAQMAGIKEIPAVILELNDEDAAQAALIENIQRENLNPMEEAQAYRTLLDTYSMTQESLSQRIGKSRSAIANTLRLLDMNSNVQEYIINGTISAGHARAILSVKSEEGQAQLAATIIKKELSVRAAEAEAKAINARMAAPQTKEETSTEEIQFKAYYKELEHSVSGDLGRKFKIIHGKINKVEISFSDSKDLEALIKNLCGDGFFSEN